MELEQRNRMGWASTAVSWISKSCPFPTPSDFSGRSILAGRLISRTLDIEINILLVNARVEHVCKVL